MSAGYGVICVIAKLALAIADPRADGGRCVLHRPRAASRSALRHRQGQRAARRAVSRHPAHRLRRRHRSFGCPRRQRQPAGPGRQLDCGDARSQRQGGPAGAPGFSAQRTGSAQNPCRPRRWSGTRWCWLQTDAGRSFDDPAQLRAETSRARAGRARPRDRLRARLAAR